VEEGGERKKECESTKKKKKPQLVSSVGISKKKEVNCSNCDSSPTIPGRGGGRSQRIQRGKEVKHTKRKRSEQKLPR